MDIKRVVGRNIRMAPKAQALRQLVPAEQSELSTDFIGKVERGTTSPSIESLKAVATAMNVSLGELLAGELQEDARQEALIELIGLCGGGTREDIELLVKGYWRRLPPCFSNGSKTGHGDPRGGSVRATPQNRWSRALVSAPQRRRPRTRRAFMGHASMSARHARRTPGKAADDARYSGIRGQPSARCRTPGEAARRHTYRLWCPKPSGVGSVWIVPLGDHGAAGPRDNRVAPRAQPSRPAEPPPRADSRMAMRAEAAEARGWP